MGRRISWKSFFEGGELDDMAPDGNGTMAGNAADDGPVTDGEPRDTETVPSDPASGWGRSSRARPNSY